MTDVVPLVDPVEVLLSFRDDPALAAAAARTLLSGEARAGRLVSTVPVVRALASLYWLHRDSADAATLASVAVSFDEEGARAFLQEITMYALPGQSMDVRWFGGSVRKVLRRLDRVPGTRAAVVAFASAQLHSLCDLVSSSREPAPNELVGPLRHWCRELSDRYVDLVRYIDDPALLIQLTRIEGGSAEAARKRILRRKDREMTYELLSHTGHLLDGWRWTWAARHLTTSERVALYAERVRRRDEEALLAS